MLSKSKISEIKLLEKKKYRDETGLFVAEGNKLVADMLDAFKCEWLIARASWMATRGNIPAKELLVAEDDEIRKISFLKTPQDVFGIFRKPVCNLDEATPAGGLVLVLDGVQDPGNLGTVVRLADWFGIKHIICSLDTADVYGVKAVQATMGALAHVKIHYTDICAYLAKYQDFPVYGTFLEGDIIYNKELSSNAVIVMGNEGNGIRSETASLINERLFIPPYKPCASSGDDRTMESLNVAVAASIICSEFRRKCFLQ